ncbi:MAG: N utilization substance protein B-like protein [Thermoanaerobacterales bacterium 50_218]|nr:MAG: N utilization substance protein B-like protein [Thermoanaerobacterales bacterium 50_218]HAA90467.1 transcription antitermination factor NusB [Peptococcaceae bacterium]
MGRRKAREIALQVLFQVDVGKVKPERALVYTLNEFQVTGPTAEFARQLVEGTLAHRQEIDHLIEKYSIDWPLSRMANVDRNILRIGLYEMLYHQETPLNVAIDEAIELAKKYSHDDAPRFINGILGQIAKELKAKVDQHD